MVSAFRLASQSVPRSLGPLILWLWASTVGAVRQLRRRCRRRGLVVRFTSPDPCQLLRRPFLEDWFLSMMEGNPCLFVTLTLGKDSASLSERLNRLLLAWSKLRRLKRWSERVKGGGAVVQITRGKSGGHWHVHLHAVVQCRYLDARWLSSAWHECTGDSFIVDVRGVTDARGQAKYLARYATKGIDRSVVCDPESLLECVVCLRGRRLLLPFGGWFGRDTEAPTKPCREYRRVGRVVEIINSAKRGEQWAIGVLRSLNRADAIPLPSMNLPGDPPPSGSPVCTHHAGLPPPGSVDAWHG
jgi:hypothetical protein